MKWEDLFGFNFIRSTQAWALSCIRVHNIQKIVQASELLYLIRRTIEEKN